jgi:hypothetical protein
MRSPNEKNGKRLIKRKQTETIKNRNPLSDG